MIKKLFISTENEPYRNEALAQYYDEIEEAILPLSDERIAEIYCEMNWNKIPKEFIHVTAFKNKDVEKRGTDIIYFHLFSVIVHEYVTKQLIHKTHKRNLAKTGFKYGQAYVSFNEEEIKKYLKIV